VLSSFVSLGLQRRIEQKDSSQLHESNTEPHSTFSENFWTHVLEDFLIQLSDQQLLLGLVVLVCAFAEYYRSSLGGNDNLWHAADVACFSMSSHAATMLALRVFFREHKKLAAARVSLMIVVFGLWSTIGYYMLHPGGPYQKTMPIVRFWHGATYIEFIGVSWAYTLTCVPIFISNEAIAVGRAVSANDRHRLGESLKIWEEKCMLSSRRWYNIVSLLKLPRSIVIGLLSSLKEGPKWKTYVLSIIFGIFFSRGCTGVVLSVLWLFTLSALGVSYSSSKRGMSWDFGQLLSLAMLLLPLQSFPSAIASTFQFYIP